MIGSLTERHVLPVMASATILTGIGRIHFDSRSASFFRFAEQLVKKTRPRGVCNALSKTMVVHHPVDMQVFHTDDAEMVHDFPAFLMSEVVTPKSDTLIHTRHSFAML